MIITANLFLGMSWEEYNENVVMPFLAKHGIRNTKVAEGELKAEVNHGRWIAKCECGGAEKMWENGKFMCHSCWNGGHKHQYRIASFPKNRKEIEGLLLKRPIINRNWNSSESLADLKRENKEHEGELL